MLNTNALSEFLSQGNILVILSDIPLMVNGIVKTET